MKTNLLKRYALLMLSTLLCTIMQGQAKDNLFKPRYETTKVRSFRNTFTHSDSIALDDLGTIYALAIDAIITQPRESSFVRVVLEDKEGHQYLVAECDRFRYDQDIVNLSQFCQETAALKGIVPAYLRCYVGGEATIQLSAIHTSFTSPVRGVMNDKESEEIRKEQARDIVDRINAYNLRHGKLWIAGVTNRAITAYDSSKVNESTDTYCTNIKYYKNGIYEMGERKEPTVRQQTGQSSLPPRSVPPPILEDFDWTNYQGQNYMTSVKDQGEREIVCTAFAATAVMEAYANAYYNQILNVDLSEAQIIDTLGIRHGHYTSNAYDVLGKITEFGVINESEWEYYPDDPSVPIPYPMNCERTYISDTLLVHVNSTNLQPIKEAIITKGPGVSGYKYPISYDVNGEPREYTAHAMALVGFGKIRIGDSISILNNDVYSSGIVYPHNNSLIGQTYWLFKNSDGIDSTRNDRHNGYIKILFNDYKYMSDACFIDGPVIRSQHSDTIAIADHDGDGYFYWGITEEAPDCLVEDLYYMPYHKDADDTNASIGKMNNDYTYQWLSPQDEDTLIITSRVAINKQYNGRRISIKNHGVLIVNTMLYNHRDVCIWIENGGTLIVNGGIIQNGYIVPESGGTFTIRYGGRIIHSFDDDNYFEVPVGAKFNLLRGEIKYREN